MGFVEDLTVYWWNWMVYDYITGYVTLCWWFGGWGLTFDDDDGEWMMQCLDSVPNGLNAKFPYLIQSSFAEEPPAPHSG